MCVGKLELWVLELVTIILMDFKVTDFEAFPLSIGQKGPKFSRALRAQSRRVAFIISSFLVRMILVDFGALK